MGMSEVTYRLDFKSFFFFFFGVVLYFRIQKERVSEREKDLEVLQEKLAERVSYLVI